MNQSKQIHGKGKKSSVIFSLLARCLNLFSALDLSDDKSPAPAAPQTEEKPQQEQQEQKPGEVATEEQKPAKPKSTKPEPIYMPYVVIGTGTAAFAAANAIRERDPGAQVPVYAPVSLGWSFD